MSVRCSRFSWLGVIAAVCATGLLWASAFGQSQTKTEKIEFSDPKGSNLTTNLSLLPSSKDRLNQFEDALTQPGSGLGGKGSSLGGVMIPPPRMPAPPAIQSRRVKDLLDQRKNWYLMSPEDLASMPSTQDMFGVPTYGKDGQDKEQDTVLQRYFERLDQPRKKRGETVSLFPEEELSGRNREITPRDPDTSRPEFELPSTLRDSERKLRSLFEDGSSSSTSGGGLGDFLGAGGADATDREQALAHKSFMQEYKKLINGVAPGAVTPLGFSTDPAGALGTPKTAMDSLTTLPKPDTGNTISSVINPRLNGPKLPDLNAQALNQWNPLQADAQPGPPAPRPPPFTSTLPDFPRRKF